MQKVELGFNSILAYLVPVYNLLIESEFQITYLIYLGF